MQRQTETDRQTEIENREREIEIERQKMFVAFTEQKLICFICLQVAVTQKMKRKRYSTTYPSIQVPFLEEKVVN